MHIDQYQLQSRNDENNNRTERKKNKNENDLCRHRQSKTDRGTQSRHARGESTRKVSGGPGSPKPHAPTRGTTENVPQTKHDDMVC